MALDQYTPGFRLIDGGQLNAMVDEVNNLTGNGTPGPVTASTLVATGAVVALDNIETGITAHAGGGQASAYQLSKVVSLISTVATAANSVKLPAPTTVGQLQVVINGAASNSMQVFGFGTDTINGVATGTGVAQAAGKTGLFVATSTGTAASWYRILSA